MRRLPKLGIALIALCTVASVPIARADLRSDIDRHIRSADLATATVSVAVLDGETGRELASVDASHPLIPASNQKLLTTGTALDVLGPDFRFQTSMRLVGDQLWFIGDGDPALADPYLLPEMGEKGLHVDEFLELLVDPIAARGITALRELIIDDRVFDRETLHPDWPRDQLQREYCAEVAGVNFHFNSIWIYPKAGGSRPNIDRFDPYQKWIDITNRGKCDPNKQQILRVSREYRKNHITFGGNVYTASQIPARVTLHDPAMAFGRLLQERLEAAGVRVEKVRLAEPTERAPGAAGTAVGPVIETPLELILHRCNTDSENLYAEALLKRVAYARTRQAGSWLGGASVVRHVAHDRLGDARLLTGLDIADGSGMSRNNRVTTTFLAAWLRSFYQDETLGPLLLESLAEGGVSGTLDTRPLLRRSRLGGAEVRAKTGYINRVSCLSGYVLLDGHCACFSIIINDFPSKSYVQRSRDLQDQIVKAIAQSLARRTTACAETPRQLDANRNTPFVPRRTSPSSSSRVSATIASAGP